MAIKTILAAPKHFDTLRRLSFSVCRPGSDECKALVDDLTDTLVHHRSLGLAAPQIGVKKRVFITDISHSGDPLVIINPIVVAKSRPVKVQEACESFPGAVKEATRYDRFIITYHDMNNKQQTLEAAGLLAQALQHEIGHLNGDLLFKDNVDYLMHRTA